MASERPAFVMAEFSTLLMPKLVPDVPTAEIGRPLRGVNAVTIPASLPI
jgi:hypothetical protein